MYKTIASVCLVVVCCYFAEAATRNEVNNAINVAGNEVRQREMLAIQTSAAEALASATLPAQRACINRQRALGLRDLNTALNLEQNNLRTEYGLQTPEQLVQLDAASVAQDVSERLSSAASANGNRADLIRQC